MSVEAFSELVRAAWLGLANHLWQATLFAGLAAAAAAALGRGPARARTAVWLLASAKFALPLALFAYLGSLAGLDAIRPAAPALAPAGGGTTVVWAIVEPAAVVAPAAATAPRATGWFLALTAVWLVGASAALGFWLARRRFVEQAIGVGRELLDGREVEALASARRRLGVSKQIDLVVSRAVPELGVWRVFRPVVVLPEGVADGLGDDELEAVMMHEVAHVARRDNLVANLQMALCCAFWFNPVVWAIDRKLLAERERACDEAVIGAGGRARAYATGLLKVFRFAIGRQPAGVSCATGSHLGRRIEQIMSSSDRISTNWHRAVLATVVLGMVGVSVGAAALGQGERREVRTDVLVAREPGKGGEADLEAAAAAAPSERTIAFDAVEGSPITVDTIDLKKVSIKALAEMAELRGERNARIRLPDVDVDGNALVLLLTLTNTSDRAVTGYMVSGHAGKMHFIDQFARAPLPPGQTVQIALPVGGDFAAGADALRLSVTGVQFEDGATWGDYNHPGGGGTSRRDG